MDMKQTLDQLKTDLVTFGEKALALEEDNIKKLDDNNQITAHVRMLERQLEEEKIKSRDLVESNTILERTKQELIEEKAVADQERDNLVAKIENLNGQCAILNEQKEAIYQEKEEEKQIMLRDNEELREQLRGKEELDRQIIALQGEKAALKEEKATLQKRLKGESKNARRNQNLLTATAKKLKATEVVVKVGELVMKHRDGQFDNFVNEMKQDGSGSVLAQAKSLAAKFDHETEDKNTKDSRDTSKRLFKELNKSTKEVQSMLNTTEKRGIKLEAKRLRLDFDPTDFLRLDFGGAGEGEELGQNLDQQVELNQQGEDEMELEEVVVPAVIHHPDPLQGP